MSTAQFPLEEVPRFYQTYVKLVNDRQLIDAMEFSLKQSNDLVSNISDEKGLFRYAPDKWTIKELLVHIMDAERIFAYRALRFSRNDKTNLPGFEENDYVPHSDANERSIKQIIESQSILRRSTIDLFRSFSKEALARKGSANNTEISVEAIGYVVSGHQLHHLNVLKERYLKA